MLNNRSFKIYLAIVGLAILLVYWWTWPRNTDELEECCQDLDKRCLACRRHVTIEKFCSENPDRFNCPLIKVNKTCCRERDRYCLACKARISVAKFCREHPGEYGCQRRGVDCCEAKSKECVACQHSVSVDEICVIYPGLYGCSHIEHGEIMIGISVFNKKGYTQFTASTLRLYHNISERDIYIFDGGSFYYTEDDLRQWYGKGVNILPSSDETFGLSSQVSRVLDSFVNSDYKVLFLVDGETVFSAEWRTFITKYIHNETDGFLSLHHSAENHIYTANCERMEGDLCVGQVHGKVGVAITHNLATKIVKRHPGEFNEFNWTNVLEDEGIRLLYPEKSLTMQIGQKDQGEDNCGKNEVAYRFKRCDLPNWIRNGIEFYFDRCTSPDEVYFPEHSMTDIEKSGRFWTRPAISYSFYGSRPRYTQIAVENALRVFSIYPGWKIWIYTDRSPPNETLDKLCEFDVRFIDMSNTEIKSRMSWRFLVASEPVKMYAVRDVDSYLLKRGKAAVDEWIKSGRKFHVLRDHPNHSRYPMSGGMWGGTQDAIPNMKDILLSRQMNDRYMQDMNFLNGVIWNITKRSVWAHDSHSIHKFGEDHPFPTKLEGKLDFVGKVVLYPEPKSLEELGPRFP